MICYECVVPVSSAQRQIHYLQYAFSLLQKHICFFKFVFFNEVISNISQLRKKSWNLILINFDLFIIKLMKRIILFFLRPFINLHFTFVKWDFWLGDYQRLEVLWHFGRSIHYFYGLPIQDEWEVVGRNHLGRRGDVLFEVFEVGLWNSLVIDKNVEGCIVLFAFLAKVLAAVGDRVDKAAVLLFAIITLYQVRIGITNPNLKELFTGRVL